MPSTKAIEERLAALDTLIRSPLDVLPYEEYAEKLIYLELQGPPDGIPKKIAAGLAELSAALAAFDVQETRVVVLGGGTGLSNIIGGDSRNKSWPEDPFSGLKEIFPRTKAVVCVTDDGGSTGELLKDLPLVALGDLRHVLLSSIRKRSFQEKYGLDEKECYQVAGRLHQMFNYRFDSYPGTLAELSKAAGLVPAVLPEPMQAYLEGLLETIFADRQLAELLTRPHCLGNLLLAAAIWKNAGQPAVPGSLSRSMDYRGLKELCRVMALAENAVMPCSLTPAVLQVLYSNGALVTGEYKSSHARRGYPVDRVFVSFVEEPEIPAELIRSLAEADVIILAPGSLYTSTIPIFQVPGLAAAVRRNKRALKLLVANLWVQKGETDVVRDDPKRRFYVSDLIKAYQHNTPGGVRDLFSHVLSLGLQGISGSVLQNYAMEDKIPIFMDREKIESMGFKSIEAGIFSQAALHERNVIQHDPAMLARAIRTLMAITSLPGHDGPAEKGIGLPQGYSMELPLVQKAGGYSCERYEALKLWLQETRIRQENCGENIEAKLLEILWFHRDILLDHLANIKAIEIIDRATWSRSQEWDNVFSFYDPEDSTIKICHEVVAAKKRFEPAFLVALGQSLLGNYAAAKEMEPLGRKNEAVGKIFRLTVRSPQERNTFLGESELNEYLKLARMVQSGTDAFLYSRLVNGQEGFTPPGMLFGLVYAWYLDNRFAAHVEYKMAIMRTKLSDLIPEQVREHARRKSLVLFFRRSVFRQNSPLYDE
jgi:uncharacterized cofD-like protein